ncbi:MAG TPA: Na+/H+ antiporter NhaC family protein [Gemmatimonadales bacterium]
MFLRRILPLMTVVAPLPALGAQEIEVDVPAVILTGIPFNMTVRAPTALDSVPLVLRTATGVELQVGMIPPVGEIVLRHVVVDDPDQLPLRLEAGAAVEEIVRPLVPGWTSVLPPLVAIVLALAFHEVVSSLFVGLWLGAFIVTGYNPFKAVLVAIDGFVQPALANGEHAAIVVFSLMLGGMVGVMARMGGTWAIVDAVTPLATSRRRGLFATWVAGLAIFFDDYANTLIVGNTMRPLTDRLRISREKLAYVVDSTAAPVTVIVFVSTWVGFEIGLIGDSLRLSAEQSVAHPELASALSAMSPFSVFISTIPYLFYPIMAIIAVALFIWTGRDFGPMLAAERRAASGKGLHAPGAQLAADPTTQLEGPPEGAPLRWWNGAMPVLAVVVAVVLGLYVSGKAALPDGQPGTLSNILGSADPFKSLLWGAMFGCLTAVFLAVGQRILTLTQAIDAWVAGLRAMLLAMVILVLAWSLGEVTQAIGTAPFLTSVLSSRMPVTLLPVTVFLVAALISFSTGTSWATMAILFPLVVPLAVALGDPTDIIAGTGSIVLHGAISSVMAGSIFGDHCSPISDTTVLSSTASGCDHVDHVRTQLPYAIVVALITMTVGDLGTSLGLSPWLALLIACAVLWAVIRVIGQPVEVA